MDRNRLVVGYNVAGICSRLKCLFSAMRMSDNYRIIWDTNRNLGCSFNELFENEISLENTFHTAKNVREKFGDNCYFSWRFLVLPEDNIDYKRIDFMFNNTPDVMRKIYLEKIKILKPVKYVRDQVKRFSKNFDNKTVSVSIRSWVYKYVTEKVRAKSFNLNNFIEAMDKIKNDTSIFFVTSDSDEIIEELKNIFPNKIISFPNRTPRNDLRSHAVERGQDMLIDLFLGGKNKRFIVSVPSAYTELQWWFGGCLSYVTKIKAF